MTEKRFTAFTDYLGGTQTILDNGERKTLQELLDTMNELAEENEQLKDALNQRTEQCDKYYEENEQLKQELSEQGTQLDFLKDENKHMRDLVNENEQLKQREKTLEGMIRTFDEGCKEIYDDKCRLEEENEQLKQEVENIKDVNVRCCNDYSHYRRENEQLKSILKIYHKVANCRNCHYHDYDTLFGGYDDYEICNKGNDVSDGICSEWREH